MVLTRSIIQELETVHQTASFIAASNAVPREVGGTPSDMEENRRICFGLFRAEIELKTNIRFRSAPERQGRGRRRT